MDVEILQQAQAKLAGNCRQGNHTVRNKMDALLRELIRGSACDAPMMHTFTSKNGKRLYRYDVCVSAKKRGTESCLSPSIQAEELEQFVVQQI